MRMSSLKRRLQRGTVSLWIVMGAVPLSAIMGFGVDLANVVNAQSSVQNYVDAKAVAGLKEVILAPVQQIDVGDFLNFHFEGDVGYTDEEPIAGAWDFTDAIPFFQQGGAELSGVPAMRVSIDEADGFEYPLFFGGLLGMPTVTLQARATAFTGARHVVLVQDISGSMIGDPIDLAREALQAFVEAMAQQDLPGDHVGLVEFAEEDETEVVQGLTSLYGGVPGLLAAIQGLTTEGLTNQAAGIELARGLFVPPQTDLINRIIVVVSDGGPSEFDGDVDTDCAPHTAAAAAAHDVDGIEVFSVFIGASGAPQTALDCAESFAQGRGTFYEADDASDLDEILVDIVSRVPVRLVE